MSSYSKNKNMSLEEINVKYSSPEAKRKYLQEQMVKRIAAVNGANNGTKGTSMTVDELVNYGNNADLLDRAANGESVTLSTPRTDYLAAMNAGYTPSSAPTNTYYSTLSRYALGNKNASYAMAEKARQESEALAEIQRKRSIVDASTMAEQQKATYGANAEQVGRMGLQVSGYSDYLNSQAYAAGMAGRQAANAQATDANRKAMYTEMMAKLEADKEYNNALAQIETAKYNEQREDKAQQQTNYMALLEAISNGNISKDSIGTYASALGITDSTMIDNATKYADNTTETLTEKQIADLTATRDAQMIAKDYVGAAKTNAQITYPNATLEQRQLYESADIVSMMDTISSDPSSWSSIASNLSNYGEQGAKNIKEAFSNSEYVASAESLGKKELKAVIDSGLLTDEAKSKLETIYASKYEDKKQTTVYDADVFGKYSNPDKASAEQSAYADAIIRMAEEGKLKNGDIVAVNLGAGTQQYYKYVEGGKFEKVNEYDIKYNLNTKIVDVEGYEITRVLNGTTTPYYSWKVEKKK